MRRLIGGVTMVLAMPNTSPSLVGEEELELVETLAAKGAACDFGLFAGATADNAADLPKIARRCAGLKMYLNTTFGPLKLPDMPSWQKHLQNWPKNHPIVCHAEGETTAAIILQAHLAGRPIHICHVSSKAEIETIVAAKKAGMRVTCEVAPHHLFLSREELPEKVREVRPPLGTKADQEALWAHLNYIDVFATDHAPHTKEEKLGASPPPGFPGLETMLPLLLDAVNKGRLPIEDLVDKLHTNPIRIFHLPPQPKTFVEVLMDADWKIDESSMMSKAGWSPFAGWEGKGKVHRVVLRGEEAYVDGKILVGSGFGLNVRSDDYPTKYEDIRRVMKELVRRKTDEDALLRLSVGDDERAPSPMYGHRHLKSPRPPRGLVGRSLLRVESLTRDQLHRLFSLASNYKKAVETRKSLAHILEGYVMALMFLEPSTRTSGSFDAAMKRLGGQVLTLDYANSSSVKGESLEDSVRVMGSYSDILVLRTGKMGDPERAARSCGVPVINAGDGTGQHPTQALLDVFTIREEIGTAKNITIAMVGDLKHGRTVHSLARLMTLYEGTRFIYVAAPGLEMPQDVQDFVVRRGFRQDNMTLEEAVREADVVYMTRVQRERFTSSEEYERCARHFRLTPQLLSENTIRPDYPKIMHPLPRNDEVSPELDSETSRAVYFRQARYGMFVRMALLATILNRDDA